jgi:hypothetical protein
MCSTDIEAASDNKAALLEYGYELMGQTLERVNTALELMYNRLSGGG